MSCFPITAQINECGVTTTNFTFEQDALIGNWDDILSYTRGENNKLEIGDLLLKSGGKKMYPIIFKEDNPMSTLTETTEEKSYAKPSKIEGEIIIYGRTPAAALIKQKLDNNKIFMILKQSAKKANTDHSYYVILGLESGLKPTAGENFVGDKGGYVFKFMADNLTYPQEFLWKTDVATTNANYAALQVATGA